MASHSADKRVLARKLRRRKRLTIDQISARLGVSRSTVYKWVGDIRLPGSGPGGGFTDEARRKGNLAMLESRRRQREQQYLFGLEMYENMRAEPGFRDFLVSYVALGKKGSWHEVSFSHPDPHMMRMAAAWLEAYGRNRLRYRLHLAPGADRARAVDFWAKTLAIDPGEIKFDRGDDETGGPSSVRKSNLLGAMRISSTDTLLRIELQAWIDCARSEWREIARETS